MRNVIRNNKNLIGLFVVLVLLAVVTLILMRNAGIQKENMNRIMGRYEAGDHYLSIGNDSRIWLNLPSCSVPESTWIPVDNDVILIRDGAEEAFVAEFHEDTAWVFEAVHGGKEEGGEWIFDYDQENPICVLKKK